MTLAIDFLPEEYRRKHRGRRFQAWSLVVAGAVGLFVAASIFAQRYQCRQVQCRLAAVSPHYEQCLARQRALDEIRKELAAERSAADLYAWLGSCWTRSGMLAAVACRLPESVQFEQVQVVDEEDRPLVPARNQKAPDEKILGKLKPAERDLRQLREEASRARTMLRITGTTTDGAALHRYLGELGGSDLFLKAEIESLERVAGSKQESSRFRAVLLVRPGYGAANGPVAVRPAETQPGHIATTNPSN